MSNHKIGSKTILQVLFSPITVENVHIHLVRKGILQYRRCIQSEDLCASRIHGISMSPIFKKLSLDVSNDSLK